PGGHVTGFTLFEYSISVKWLELLKENRSPRDASGGHSECGRFRWERPVRRNPGSGAVIWGGGAAGRGARRARDRARRHCIRAILEWRSDRDGDSPVRRSLPAYPPARRPPP